MVTTFVTFLFAFLHTKPLLKWSILLEEIIGFTGEDSIKERHLLTREAKMFLDSSFP